MSKEPTTLATRPYRLQAGNHSQFVKNLVPRGAFASPAQAKMSAIAISRQIPRLEQLDTKRVL